MNDNKGEFEWRPIILTDKATGRKVHITIFERELYKSGFFTFEDLWEINNPTPEAETPNATNPETN
jgi:hypothetical protein